MGTLSRNLENFRFWGFRRFGKRSEVKRQAIFLAVFDASATAELKSKVERAFAFASSSQRLNYKMADANITAEAIIEMSPSRVIFVGCSPLKAQLRSLKYLDVSFAKIDVKTIAETSVIDANQFGQRGGISEVVGRRNAVYAHEPNRRNIPILIHAFLEAKRQYPDLLLMLNGVSELEIEDLSLDLKIIKEDASKSRRQLGDILVSESKGFLPQWAASANLCVLLAENNEISECANIALGSGASLLTYSVSLEEHETLFELEAIGAIWSAQRPNLLAAAMTQALSPEKAALTVGQSLERLTATEDQLSQAIDALLDQE